MNLSVKNLGQLAVLAVALFFFSCKEETSPIGFKNPNPKFENHFVEIPITSSVVLLDSVRTSNGDASNDLNRLMVGKYNDPELGNISSTIFAQFFPAANLVGSASADYDTLDPVIESVELRLLVDYYSYGLRDETSQTFKIHKLTQDLPRTYSVTVSDQVGGQQKPVEITSTYRQVYFNKSSATYDASPVGTLTTLVNGTKYDQELNEDDTYDTLLLVTPLENAMGQQILDLMNTPDFRKSIFSKPANFLDIFKGLAIVPETADKMIRFYLPGSKIRLKYKHKTKSYTLDLGFGNASSITSLISFNAITQDRTGTALENIAGYYTPFEPANDKRYIQSGTGLATIIDFSRFLEFADTIDQMQINLAEFVIKNIDEPGVYTPPSNLVMKIIRDDNGRFKKIAYPGKSTQYAADVKNINLYKGYINYDAQNTLTTGSIPFDSTLNVVNDFGTFLTLGYDASNKKYSGAASLFFQQLFLKDESKIPYTKAVLMPYVPSSSTSIPYGVHVFGKNVSRVVFNKDNIVLRIYYTIPTVQQNQ